MTVDEQVRLAEACWLAAYDAGPTEPPSRTLTLGDAAPDAELPDATGAPRRLSQFWAAGPALVIFWRHFGCGCGMDRARRLAGELDDLTAAGLSVVIVGQGEPARAAAYAAEHAITVPILSDPGAEVYRAYGIGHWQPEQVFFDAPTEYLGHPPALGRSLMESRRQLGRPMVDDPWRAAAEFVVTPGGVVRLGYAYQYCEDFPDPRVFTSAAVLIRHST
jgi:peroxiredoxin